MDKTYAISKKVNFVVVLIDDYADNIITDKSAWVYVEGEKPPIHKQDGYYVFCDVSPQGYGDGMIRFSAGGGRFITRELVISPDIHIGKEIVVKVRLRPNHTYGRQNKGTVIYGTAPAHCQIRFYFGNEKSPYKLLEPYTEGYYMNIYHQEDRLLDGKSFSIGREDSDMQEDFHISHTVTLYCCSIENNLEGTYEKAGTNMQRMCIVQVNETEEFSLLLPQALEGSQSLTYRVLHQNKQNNTRFDSGLYAKTNMVFRHIDVGRNNLLEIKDGE